MSWDTGNQAPLNKEDVNKRILEMEGFLEEPDAKYWLYKFLRENISFTSHLLTGIELFPFQHMAIKAMMECDYSLFIWSRGLSKCSKYSDLVCTDKGIKKIIDVQKGDYIQAKNNMCLVEGKTINPKEKTYKVTTKKGYESEGLDYHRVLTLDENLNEVWKYAKDLKKNDVMIMRKNFEFPKQYNIFEGMEKDRFADASIEEWYYFFGLLIGDGHISKKYNLSIITSHDKEVLDFVISFTRKIGLNPNIKQTAIRINSTKLTKFLERLGFDFAKSHNKKIPSKLLKCSKSNAEKIIQGLFDTDGFASLQEKKEKNSRSIIIGFTSSSYELIKQVRMLLLGIGIVSKTSVTFKGGDSDFGGKIYQCNKAWSIVITSQKNLRIFDENIGFFIKRKQKILDIVKEYKYKNCEFSDYIPLVGDYLSKKLGKKSIRSRKENYKFSFGRYTSKRLAKEILKSNRLDREDNDKIQKLLDENLFFDLVDTVEESEEITVDLQVENEHCYVTEGFINHNSFSAGVFALLDAMINQGVHIGIISKSFRQAKQIFKKIEDIADDKKAELFAQCIGRVNKANDEWSMQIGQSRITALPLGDGEKLRGFRFQRIIIDELLLMPEKVYNEVIMPFLAVIENPTEKQKIQNLENKLIAAGKMEEEDRVQWPSNKLIGLSSASYKFEYLYKVYQQYENSIFNPGHRDNARRVIMQLSYDTAPSALYDENLISQAKASMSQSQIDREFGAIFTDDSAGYFKISKMSECTITDGEAPCVEISGEEGAEYILSFDPSWSEAETSDDFAIQVIKLHPERKTGTLVHSYALSGTNLRKHIEYFEYILSHFNIVFIVGDYNGGVQFINAANESEIFKQQGLDIKYFEADFDNPEKYQQSLKESRREYNYSSQKICHLRKPTSSWIRTANEQMQSVFDHKKLFFASSAMDDNFKAQQQKKIPIQKLKFLRSGKDEQNIGARMIDFIEHQKDMIDLTKAECALIQVATSPNGSQTFDLPSELKRQKGVDRAKKDSYSALLLGSWGMNMYYDMMSLKEENNSGFTPIFIN